MSCKFDILIEDVIDGNGHRLVARRSKQEKVMIGSSCGRFDTVAVRV